jgi:hypothetical protein
MFPSEFADLLNARGRRLLARPPQLDAFRRRGATPIVLLDGIIDDRVAAAASAACTPPSPRR